jgi:uncharacterized damage-inducible protein DinB
MNLRDGVKHFCDLAFSADQEMSLMAAVSRLEAEHLSVKRDDQTWSIEEILYHVGSCKLEYCRQGFQLATPQWEWPRGDLAGIMVALRAAHAHMIRCLETCEGQDLGKSVPTRFHGETAAHFFSVMAMHDTAHAAQIRSVLRCAGIRTGGWYPVGLK